MAFDLTTITEDAFNVTPSDTALILAFGLFTCDGGTIVFKTSKGTQVTAPNLAPGTFLPVAVKQVMATGTTSKSIIAFGPT